MQKILISLLVILLSSLTLLFSQNTPWDCAMGTGISSNVFVPFSIATCIDDDYRGTDFNEDLTLRLRKEKL